MRTEFTRGVAVARRRAQPPGVSGNRGSGGRPKVKADTKRAHGRVWREEAAITTARVLVPQRILSGCMLLTDPFAPLGLRPSEAQFGNETKSRIA
jgi:hypothetical protein